MDEVTAAKIAALQDTCDHLKRQLADRDRSRERADAVSEELETRVRHSKEQLQASKVANSKLLRNLQACEKALQDGKAVRPMT